MNILVAGGAGFIGSTLVEQLVQQNHDVTVVDNFSTGCRENLESFLEQKKVTLIRADVADPATLAGLLRSGPFERVYDLACPTGVPNIGADRLGVAMMEACGQGTRNLLELAHQHQAKFLLTSSSEVYGEPLITPQTESYTGNVDTLGFRAPYEEGKRFAETWVSLYVRKFALEAKMVRLYNVYGPNMSSEDFRVLPRFVTQALKNQPLSVQGSGSQTRTFCFEKDIVDGLVLTMEQGTPGEVYNLGSGKELSILEFAKTVIRLCGSESTIGSEQRPSHDHTGRMPDLTKIQALGWKQQVPLEEGLKLTIKAFRTRHHEN